MSKADVIGAWEKAAAELETAAAHLRTAARHMREDEVPRACAHALAASGHVHNADAELERAARIHASRAVP